LPAGQTTDQSHLTPLWSVQLDDGLEASTPDEARRMPARVGGAKLVLGERTDPLEQLELVAQVRAHHLGAVRRDGERDAVLDEGAEGVTHGRLVRERLREQVR